MLLKKASKAQAAIDFISSYGVALVIITITIAVLYETSILSPLLAASACAAAPGFSCDTYALNASGVLSVSLSQATGGPIVVRGAACSSQLNGTGGGPKYGNPFVTNSLAYYPPVNGVSSAPANGIYIYSGSGTTLNLYCYSPTGAAAGGLGTPFIGYLWLNYTVPNYGSTVQQVASLSLVRIAGSSTSSTPSSTTSASSTSTTSILTVSI